MKFIKSKKGFALLAILAVAAIASVGAYAYFTSAGSGNGTATAGSDTTHITLAASGFGGIVPGDGGQSVSFTATVDTGVTSGYVHKVTFVSVTSPNGPCQSYLTANPGDFSMADVTENQQIPADSNAHALANTGTLIWADSAADQTPCAGQSLQLNVASS